MRPIEEHIEAYQSHLEAKGNDPNHVSYTLADIRRFVAFSGAQHVAAIEREQVDRWVNESLKRPQTKKLKKNKTKEFTYSHRTINRHVKSLQGFLKHMHEHHHIGDYVLRSYNLLKLKGHETRRRRFLTIEEQSKLLANAPRERVDFYRFALLTGCRLNQLHKLKVHDLDFEQKTISLSAKDASHSNKLHIVPMHSSLIDMLKERCKLKLRDVQVFPDAPTKDDAAKLARKDCAVAGIDITDVDFYSLRHSFGTTLAMKGVHPKVLQALMGHSDIETTLGLSRPHSCPRFEH